MASKYDPIWSEIVNHFDIINRVNKSGYVILCLDEIKEVTDEKKGNLSEIRLLNYRFNTYRSFPPVFIENGLSAITLSKDRTAIGRFKIHEDIKYDRSLEIKRPKNIEGLANLDILYLGEIDKEAQMAAYANDAGILEEIFGENIKTSPQGIKIGSKKFKFEIEDCEYPDVKYEFSVENSGIEIDCCSEGNNCVIVQEYKPKPVKDFMIRQLYYPYRRLKMITNKDIYLMFVTLSKDKRVMHFFIYILEDEYNYSSLSLVQQYDYRVSRSAHNYEFGSAK